MRYSLGLQLNHNLKLQLHHNCKLSCICRYQSSDLSLLRDPAHWAYLTPHSPKPVQPTQPPKPDADVDPFKHELRGFDVPAAQVHGYNLSRNPRCASVDDKNPDEDEEHSEGLQLFPGSGLF
ncbi:hypothetical protein BDR06DRAFT_1012928 [Suillus hirtellus]|nr:hypothetical protein BDR06DRAFT_1012928 [Suillus hirtellus]